MEKKDGLKIIIEGKLANDMAGAAFAKIIEDYYKAMGFDDEVNITMEEDSNSIVLTTIESVQVDDDFENIDSIDIHEQVLA